MSNMGWILVGPFCLCHKKCNAHIQLNTVKHRWSRHDCILWSTLSPKRRKLTGGWVGHRLWGGQHKGSPIQCLLDKASESWLGWRAWGAPNSSVAWLLNSLTMLCLKASGKRSFRWLAAEHTMSSAAAAALCNFGSISFYSKLCFCFSYCDRSWLVKRCRLQTARSLVWFSVPPTSMSDCP